jgi:predicted P-loop ATPase/GTPase
MKFNNQQIEQAKDLIKENGLDPSHHNYGGFLSVVNKWHYHPLHRDRYKTEWKLTIGSDIYKITKNDYNVVLSSPQAMDMSRFINKQMNRVSYKKRRDELFNCYTFTYTIYLNETIGGYEKWYISGNEYGNTFGCIPFDSDVKRSHELRSEVEEYAKQRVEHIAKTKG